MFGGLVGDPSIMEFNAQAALVSQQGPIEKVFQNSGLSTSLICLLSELWMCLRKIPIGIFHINMSHQKPEVPDRTSFDVPKF